MKTRVFAFITVAALILLALPAIAVNKTIKLAATIRDFKDTHADFEKYLDNQAPTFISDDRGIVTSTLGIDGKPVYAHDINGTVTTHGPDNFNQWYRDVPGVNINIPYNLTLTETSSGSGIYGYSSNSFFPIDGLGFGNQGRSHNYHFTFEMHNTFAYKAGQIFKFTGDDDIWVYINNVLVIDLGGVHRSESKSVTLDTLGLTAGQNYNFDFFFAERHTTGSNFVMQTSMPLVSAAVPEASTLVGFGSALVMAGPGMIGWLRRRRA
jgi:fibro-slime domain-containing protein